MRANYKPRIVIPGVIDRQLSHKEAVLVQAVYDECDRQHREELERVLLMAIETELVTLHRLYGFGRDRLRRVWEESIILRSSLRLHLRDILVDGEYEIQPTGKNIEDTAIRMELRDLGVDVGKWEDTVVLDERDGTLTFGDTGRVVEP